MTRVFLDQEIVPIERPTLGAALRAVRAEAERRGRVVIEAKVDGRTVADADLERPPETDLGDAEVRFVSADPIALVRTTLADVADALDGARGDQTAAADLIQTGKIDEGLKRLGQALGVWESVRLSVTHSVALLGLDAESLALGPGGGDSRLADRVQSLAGRLGEVKRAVMAQDWSGLSDALAFEMDEQASTWSAMLRDLSETIARSGGPRGGGVP